jgi:hypothetical protein
LIGGNFNGHHLSWSNSKNCTTGNNLYHCITEFERNVTLINDGSQTYIFDATVSKAALDLNFADPRSALLYTWKVETDPWNRAHFPISTKYNGITEPRKGCLIKTPTGLPLWKKLRKRSRKLQCITNGTEREMQRKCKEFYQDN